MEKIILYAKKGCCLILLLLAANYSFAQNADIRILRSIHNNRDKSLDGLMYGFTQSAYPVSFAVPLTQLIVGFVKKDSLTIMNGVQSVGALAINTVLTYGLKYTVNRTRPYITYPDIKPYEFDTDPSFPSGHTSYAFATATTLSLQYPKWYVIAPSFAWAAVVGYSRLDLGMHYPTDVLAGAVIGAGSSYLSYKGMKWLQHHRRKKHK